MITKTFRILPIIIALILVVPTVSFADPVVEEQGNATISVEEQGNSAETVEIPAPVTTEQGNAATVAEDPAPAVVDQGNASFSVTTEDQGNASVSDNTGATPPSVEDQGNASSVSNNQNNDNNNGGGGSSSSSESSSSSSSSGSILPIQYRPAITSVGQCSYLTSYLKQGGNNPVTEVNRLQAFLKNTEKLDVDVTGIFDQKTLDAVKAFQAKYVNDTMLPWGVTTPTGQVYFTTQKKINEVYCKTNFTLTPAQTAQIEAYKSAYERGENPVVGSSVTNTELTSTSNSTTSEDSEIASATSSDQTAAVAGTSFFGRIWNAIKGIFGR